MEIVFGNPWVLLIGLLIPLLIVLHYYFFEHAKRRAIKFANFAAMKRVTGTHLVTKNNPQLIIRIIIFALIILGLSHPVLWYEGNASVKDYVIAIDTSSSMLSDDIKPDRMTVAKDAASAFLDKVQSYTQIGLVSFAGVSFIQSGMTTDIPSLKNKIDSIDVQLAGGTDIGAALVTSANLFSDDTKTKAIVLITDGSDTAGSFIDESNTNAIDYLNQRHTMVYTIGIGTGAGTPGYVNATGLFPVYDKTELKRIADLTGGQFFEATNKNEMQTAFTGILNDTKKGNLSVDLSFVLFLFSLLFLFIEWGLLNTRFRALP